MKIKRTRPYLPWQNGKVERSHREDGKILYGRKIFISEKELKTAVKKHMQRYNSIELVKREKLLISSRLHLLA